MAAVNRMTVTINAKLCCFDNQQSDTFSLFSLLNDSRPLGIMVKYLCIFEIVYFRHILDFENKNIIECSKKFKRVYDKTLI